MSEDFRGRFEGVSVIDCHLLDCSIFYKSMHGIANVKTSISSLLTVKIKLISSHVFKYEFSTVGETLVFRELKLI